MDQQSSVELRSEVLETCSYNRIPIAGKVKKKWGNVNEQ